MGFPGGSADKESACNVGDLGSIPGLGRSPGEGGEAGGMETQGRAKPSLLGPGAQALPAWEGVTEFCLGALCGHCVCAGQGGVPASEDGWELYVCLCV